MTDSEPKHKAKVISSPERTLQRRPVARVTDTRPWSNTVKNVSHAEENVSVPVLEVGVVGYEDAMRISRQYRDSIGKGSMESFDPGNMTHMAQMAKVAPVRFVFEKRGENDKGAVGHWMLYIGEKRFSDGQGHSVLQVYDPEEGVRDVIRTDNHTFADVSFNDPDNEALWGMEKTKQLTPTMTHTARDLLNPRSEEEFIVDNRPLAMLGPLQRTFADCGPLAVYAAMVARNVPQS